MPDGKQWNCPMKFIPTYSDGQNLVSFIPVRNAPGFTHRVIVNRAHVAWLATGHKPNAKSARFFVANHMPVSTETVPGCRNGD
jgi:hypothetical protein